MRSKSMLRPHLMSMFVVAAGLVAPAAAQAASTMTYFPTQVSDFAPLDKSSYQFNPIDDGAYGESFFFNGYTDRGDVVFALVSQTNYNPFNKGMGSFDINWHPAEGESHAIHVEYDAKDIKAGTPNGTMFGEKNYIKATPEGSEIFFTGETTDGDDVTVKITLRNTEAPIQVGDSNIYFGDKKQEYWGLKLLTPRGTATATLDSGGKKQSLELKGYMDHGNAKSKVPDFSDHWYRLRFFQDEWTINLHEIAPEKKFGAKHAQMLYVARNGKSYGFFTGWEYKETGFHKHDDSPYQPPNGWTLNFANDKVKISGTVTVRKEVVAVDVLGQVSFLVRNLVKAFYSNAWQHYFIVDTDFNIEADGSTQNVKGTGLATAEYY